MARRALQELQARCFAAKQRNWGRLFKVTFAGDLADLSLQEEEVESVSWMGRAELARLLDTGPVCPDAAFACRRWLASGETESS